MKEQGEITKNHENDWNIVDIQFDFKNIRLFELAKKRNKAMKKGDDEKRRQVENQIIKAYDDEYLIPIKAYVIFESEEGYLRSLRISFTRIWCYSYADNEIKGHKLHLENTQEPSNIHFENQYLSTLEYAIRILIAVIMLIIIISLGAFLLFYIRRKNSFSRHYPIVDCDLLTQIYSSPKVLENYALMEYHNINMIGMTRKALLQSSTSNL